MNNSGYSERLCGEVIRDATIGWERKLEAAETEQRPMYRPREWEQRERQKEKMIKKSAWYRPQADVAAFYPTTPGSELIKGIRKVVAEEASTLDLKIRVVERGGVNLKSKLVESEIRRNSECGALDCYLDGEQGGGHHHRAGALCESTCKLCKQANISASYIG